MMRAAAGSGGRSREAGDANANRRACAIGHPPWTRGRYARALRAVRRAPRSPRGRNCA
ncbi:hypothetical protein C7S16_6691 [Burkholderia thailandensis]|uniref:Uncharacterized protein n=1 Tax=Burkholderia thailandensis TaxID=57975 RepID=A0AAW9CPT8_BURTH|nr:hypothetical protein [Burkholderia thailandensis]